jgi:hypothetical protein
MIRQSNQSSAFVAIRLGLLFGVLEAASLLVVQVLYILHVQDSSFRAVNFGVIAWIVFLITSGPILLYYQHVLRRLRIAIPLRLVALAGAITGLCATLIVVTSNVVINLNDPRLYQALLALDEGPIKFTEITIQVLPLGILTSMLLHVTYLVFVMALFPGNSG